MLPAMMTSLAFPDRRVLRVDLYPRVTVRDLLEVMVHKAKLRASSCSYLYQTS